MICIVFAFAYDPDVAPEIGAAPRAVLARQLPRIAVAALNGGGDRGVRFFPFLGKVDGRRRFLDLGDPIAAETLCSLHGQKTTPGLLVDGKLTADRIALRLLGGDGTIRKQVDVEFQATDPWPAVRRVMFEIADAIGLAGAPPELPALDGEALGWYLIAKDDLLSLEADIEVADPGQRLRAAVEACRLAPDAPDAAGVLLDICRHLARKRIGAESLSASLTEIARAERAPGGEFLAQAAGLIEHVCGIEAAAEVWARLAREQPDHPEAAARVGVGYFRLGRLEEVRETLRRAIETGNDDPSVRAQLAAAEEVAGDLRARDRLLDALGAEAAEGRAMPAAVVRLVAGHLTRTGHGAEALAAVDRALVDESGNPGLWLERGRALVALKRGEDARKALERCLACEPRPEARAEAERLLGFSRHPRMLVKLQGIEEALADGRATDAVRLARSVVAEQRTMPEAWLFLGIARQRAGQPRRATRAYRRALRLQPEFAEAHNRLGALLASGGRGRAGYTHLRRAVELAPGEAAAWIHLAQVCNNLGRREEGLEALARAEKLGGYEEQVETVKRLFSDQP